MPVTANTILLVEDDPTSLRFTAKLLRAEGHEVRIASTAEQALSTLATFRPNLMLVDIQLPGMSGLELTRLVKQDAELKKIIVVALTACTAQSTKQSARTVGCDGYLTKPIAPRALAMRIHEYLNSHVDPRPTPVAEACLPAEREDIYSLLPQAEMDDLRQSFLAEGSAQSRHLLESLDSRFDSVTASRVVHQWVGTAGLLGFARICELSREVEALLRAASSDDGQLRATLTSLACAFIDSGAPVIRTTVPEFIVQQLAGKRFALVGFAEVEAERLCLALEMVGAKPRLFATSDAPDTEAMRACSLVMVHVRPETLDLPWLTPNFPSAPLLPLVLVGQAKHLLPLNPAVQLRAREILIDDWRPEEALMRVSIALLRSTPSTPICSVDSMDSSAGRSSAGNFRAAAQTYAWTQISK